ncbi:zinc-binding dehydrogenase [Catenulispora yoronensis]
MLAALTRFIEDGAVTPVIDRSYPFQELAEAIRYQELGHARGKVVVTMGV